MIRNHTDRNAKDEEQNERDLIYKKLCQLNAEQLENVAGFVQRLCKAKEEKAS